MIWLPMSLFLKDLSKKVYELIKDSDLGGFNSNRFDIPLLAEELLRAGVDFDMKKNLAVDVQTIFHKKEKENSRGRLPILLWQNTCRCPQRTLQTPMLHTRF